MLLICFAFVDLNSCHGDNFIDCFAISHVAGFKISFGDVVCGLWHHICGMSEVGIKHTPNFGKHFGGKPVEDEIRSKKNPKSKST